MQSRRSALITLAAVAACSSSKSSAPNVPELTRTPLPAVPVQPLASGGPQRLGDVTRGRVAVIDLWASWCEPCRDVAKKLELLAAAKKGRDLVIVGVDVGEDRATVEAHVAGAPPTYSIYLDPELHFANAVADSGHPVQLPLLLVVDRDGFVRLAHSKVDSALVALVDELLATTSKSGPTPAP